MIRRGHLGLLVTAMLLAAGAHADWDETRTTFLEPLSRELHITGELLVCEQGLDPVLHWRARSREIDRLQFPRWRAQGDTT